MNTLLTVDDLAKSLQLSKATIYRMVCEDFIPYVKIKHSVRFREKDIETWLAKRSRAGRVKRRVEI